MQLPSSAAVLLSCLFLALPAFSLAQDDGHNHELGPAPTRTVIIEPPTPPKPTTPDVDPPSCIGGGFGSCIGAYMCPQAWPQSCHCMNGIKTRCAAACGVPVPKLQDCGDPTTVKPPTTPKPEKPTPTQTPRPPKWCVCPKPAACVQSWPQSCYCEVAQKRSCAKKCGRPWDEEKETERCKKHVAI